MAISSAIIAPVIYTDGAGGGANEYVAAPGGAVYNLISNVPLGGAAIACWWVPEQSAPGSLQDVLSAFNTIITDAVVDPNNANSTLVKLSLTGFAGTNKRMRIKIYTLYQ